ncbi:hypothetical protein LIER_29756 [Lithospermum erythrorhizon]|uniref:Transposase n=1 Tax=Lithospermum erythrorhizon TaxID=34254 RepID=A0AAV3RM85_LITER
MQSPKTQKEAQRLTGRIAALTRFISRAGDPSLPFFKSIKRATKIEDLWAELDIDHRSPALSYPQAHAQVEVMNRVIFKAVKIRLQQEGGSWYQELPPVL